MTLDTTRTVRPSVRPSVRLSVRLPVGPSARPSFRASIRPSVRASVRPSVRGSVRPAGRRLGRADGWMDMSNHPSVRPPARPSVLPPVCPSATGRGKILEVTRGRVGYGEAGGGCSAFYKRGTRGAMLARPGVKNPSILAPLFCRLPVFGPACPPLAPRLPTFAPPLARLRGAFFHVLAYTLDSSPRVLAV